MIPSLDPFHALVLGALVISFIFILIWAVQLRTKNAGLIDAFWSWSVGLLAVMFACVSTGDVVVRCMVALLAGIWGVRLGTFLFIRNHGKPEDGRYRRFRDEWGSAANRNMFWFFQIQVVFALLLASAFLVDCYRDDRPAAPLLVLATLIWLTSVIGEGVADAQLERFKNTPGNKGQVCKIGLWRYSRHPNYFFECVHWLTYLVLGFGAPWFWLTLLPPLVMAFLLMKLSGIPITEAQTAKSRPGYAEYMRTTSALIPWPPKSPKSP